MLASHLRKQTWEGKVICNLVDKVKDYAISPNFFFNECIFYFWPHWVLATEQGLCVVAASRGYTLVEFCQLLIAVASLAAERGF